MQVDERRMLSREITNSRASHPGSPSEAQASMAAMSLVASGGRPEAGASTSEGYSLARQGSMNLPLPEDSGVPATHPDMCILRIRRNHLVEVGTPLPPCPSGLHPPLFWCNVNIHQVLAWRGGGGGLCNS